MTQADKQFLDNHVVLLEELIPIGSDLSVDDLFLIKDKSHNTAKSITVFDLFSLIGLSGVDGRIVRYNAISQTESILFENGNGIAIDSGKYFSSQSGVAILDFGVTGGEYFSLDVNSNNYGKAWIYGDLTNLQLGFDNDAVYYADTSGLTGTTSLNGNGVIGSNYQYSSGGIIQHLVYNNSGANTTRIYMTPIDILLGQDSHEALKLVDNSINNVFSNPSTKYAIFVGTENSIIESGVLNTVVLGGLNLYGRSSNTVYISQLGFATTATEQTLIQFTTPSADNTILIQDGSGTLAFLTDIFDESNKLEGLSGSVNQLDTDYVIEFTANGTYNLMDIGLTTVNMLRVFAGVGVTVSIVPNGLQLINDFNLPISVPANTMVSLRRFTTGWRTGD